MWKRLSDSLKGAGELRDGFLVTAAIFYFFGYIVWAIHAYRNDLGLLPALEFQYFVAGAPPVFVLLGLYLIVMGVKLLKELVQAKIGTTPAGSTLYLCWAIVALGMVAYALIFIIHAEWFKGAFPKLARSPWLTLCLAFITMVSSLFSPPTETARQVETGTKNVAALAEFWKAVLALRSVPVALLLVVGRLYAVTFFLGLAALAFLFVVELYPRIPQEFGGARPRYACLDVVKGQMSKETIEAILPIDANESRESVVRSLRVEVLFSGADVILVRSGGKVYKMTKSIIQATYTCD